jgi:hypothetical protein
MGVTRLKRKEAKNRARSSKRVEDIKRLKEYVKIASPYKNESGIILEDQVKA